jgi:hypothetical protein
LSSFFYAFSALLQPKTRLGRKNGIRGAFGVERNAVDRSVGAMKSEIGRLMIVILIAVGGNTALYTHSVKSLSSGGKLILALSNNGEGRRIIRYLARAFLRWYLNRFEKLG